MADDDGDSIATINALVKAFVILTTFFCGFRLAVRYLLPRTRIRGDWFVALAYADFIALSVCVLLAADRDAGSNSYLAEIWGAPYLVNDVYATVGLILSATTLGLARIGALLEHRCIVRQCSLGSRWIGLYDLGLATVTLAWTVTFVVLPILQCGADVNGWLDWPQGVQGRCVGYQVLEIFLISDLVLAVATVAVAVYTVICYATLRAAAFVLLIVLLPAWASIGLSGARLAIVHGKLPDAATAETVLPWLSLESTLSYLLYTEAGIALCGVNAGAATLLVAARRAGKRKEALERGDVAEPAEHVGRDAQARLWLKLLDAEMVRDDVLQDKGTPEQESPPSIPGKSRIQTQSMPRTLDPKADRHSWPLVNS